MPDDLTQKQARFVQEFLLDLNATQAAIRAGYSEKTASAQASRLLTNVKIKKILSKLQSKEAERLEITKERIIDELAKIGFANMLDYMRAGPDGDPHLDFSQLTRDQAAALSEVTVEDFKEGRGEDARDVRRIKFKLHDKKGALVDLGKHLGMFKEDSKSAPPVTIIIQGKDAEIL
jgi:phage terminase small subunit